MTDDSLLAAMDPPQASINEWTRSPESGIDDDDDVRETNVCC